MLQVVQQRSDGHANGLAFSHEPREGCRAWRGHNRPMSFASRALIALCLGCWSFSDAVAQTAPDAGLPRGFVGVSGALSSEDRSNRMRLFEDDSLYAVGVEAGVRVNGSVGVGLEWHRPSDLYGDTLVGAGRAQITGLQQEWAGVAVLRARLVGSARAAFDVVGGGGLMRQRHTRGGCTPPAPDRCEQFNGVSLDKTSAVGVFGLELPLSPAAHLSIVPQLRVWLLRRGDHWEDPATGVEYDWPNQYRSGNRLTTGVAARVTW